MPKRPRIVLIISGLTFLTSLLLVVDRGGLIAWLALILSAALFVKTLTRPTKGDLRLCTGLALGATLAWVATFYYVISTYESGEVVELAIETVNGTKTARLWVFEVTGEPVVYFDADPDMAESLLASKPLRFTRGGKTSTRTPSATKMDDLSEADEDQIFDTMETKYGDRMTAAYVYYVLLGIPRDRVALIAKLA